MLGIMVSYHNACFRGGTYFFHIKACLHTKVFQKDIMKKQATCNLGHESKGTAQVVQNEQKEPYYYDKRANRINRIQSLDELGFES